MKKLVYGIMCFAAMAAANVFAAGTVPAGYMEVACITVTDQNQYIDTGFRPYWMTDIEAHFSVPDFSSQNVLYWTRTSSSFAFITKANTADPTKTNKVRAYRSSNGNNTVETELPDYLTSTDIFYSTKFVDNRTDNTFTVNGQKVNFVAASGTGRIPNMFLFRLNDNGTLNSSVKAVVGMKLYSFTIFEDGTAVADFVPCVRDADGVAGLYDTARNSFYTNAAATGGSFGYEELTGITICPISTQVHETFEPCRPEFVVSNRTSGATWTVGGDIASPIVDVAYANNHGAGEATVTVTGKGEYAGQRASGSFTITATKLEDDNLVTTDTLARRYEANGKYIYEFKSTASAQTATAKRGLILSDYLLVGGGGGGGNNRGGGGGGSLDNYMPGNGGLGGGGNGYMTAAGANGVDGLGGGGGGGGGNSRGGNGGSGVVIFAVVPTDFEIDPIPDQILVAGGCEPLPVVHSADGDTLLVKDTDYTVSYTDNDKPGTALMTITGINGYAGKSTTISFTVCYFVDSEAATEGDGSVESPFATITNAVEKAKTAIASGAKPMKIMVANGTYEETDIALDAPVVIVGESRDGVEIVDNVAGKRAFTITHEGAEVRNLTISGYGYKRNGGQGGHVRMTAGLVSNCVIKDGRAGASAGYGHGGNVYMTGGRLERCLVANGRANWGGWTGTQECYGMGLYASGGVIDSCFFKDNRDDNNNGRNYGSVYLIGTATMVNCTVTGGYSRYGSAAGIYINSANATVVNCVAYGNYGNKDPIVSTAASNFGDKNLGRYFHCAAAFTNASCATWTVLTDADFVNYKSFAIPTHNYAPTFTELVAYMNSSDYADFDMHLRLASPAVDGGTTDPAYRPDDCSIFDLDGNARVTGTSVDIGCWEYDHTQFSCGGSLSSYGVFENDAVTFNGFAAGPSVDVVFRWDYGNGVTEDTREAAHVYRYAAGGYFTVKVKASPDGGTTWTDWYTVPVCITVAAPQMFVDSNCATPVYPYKTRATAANTLGAAVGALTNNASANQTIIGGVDIVVLKGSRSNDTGFFLATPVTIRGETGNPADAEIVDNVPGFRAFTLSHPDAVVSNLTISGNGIKTNGSQGGHVRMTAGLVSNCVIKDGRAAGAAKGTGHGGNVWMSGGRLERCFVANGRANWGGFAGADCFGMGLYASGGVIDSCFFKDNKDDNNDGRNYGSVCLAGTATLVNCTVTGGYSRYDTAGGIYISGSGAKAVNCVAYGNYGGKSPVVNTAAANFGDKNLGRYFYCAAAFTNASCATWTVLTDADFVKYETFTGTTYAQFNTYMTSAEYATFDWHQKRDSQLIGRGTLDTAYRPADSVTRDLDGNERVLNRTIDLGCWEKMLSVGFFYILR